MIAGLGLAENSSVVLVASMLISPLMVCKSSQEKSLILQNDENNKINNTINNNNNNNISNNYNNNNNNNSNNNSNNNNNNNNSNNNGDINIPWHSTGSDHRLHFRHRRQEQGALQARLSDRAYWSVHLHGLRWVTNRGGRRIIIIYSDRVICRRTSKFAVKIACAYGPINY